jgi:hypothetical protein
MLGAGSIHGGTVGRRALAALAALGAAASVATVAAPAEAALPYGPYTCKSGYVWRAAFAGDTACVTPNHRQDVANENAAAPWRTTNTGNPRWCVSGFVWREASATDFVCAPVGSRDREYTNNANAIHRHEDLREVPSGGGYISTYRTNINTEVSAGGSGFTPHARVEFWQVRTTSGPWAPAIIGARYADANGNFSRAYIGNVGYLSSATRETVVVAVDRRNGKVTRAGTIWPWP